MISLAQDSFVSLMTFKAYSCLSRNINNTTAHKEIMERLARSNFFMLHKEELQTKQILTRAIKSFSDKHTFAQRGRSLRETVHLSNEII